MDSINYFALLFSMQLEAEALFVCPFLQIYDATEAGVTKSPSHFFPLFYLYSWSGKKNPAILLPSKH